MRDQVGAGAGPQRPPGLDETGPRAREIGFKQPGARQQVVPVEQRAGTGVHRQCLDLAPAVDAGAPCISRKAGRLATREVRRTRQVLQPGRVDELAHEIHVKRDQVGQRGAGREGRRHRGVVVLVRQRHHVDRHAGMAPGEGREGQFQRPIEVGIAGDGDPGRRGPRSTGGGAGQQHQGLSAPQRSHGSSCCRRSDASDRSLVSLA